MAKKNDKRDELRPAREGKQRSRIVKERRARITEREQKRQQRRGR